MSLYLWISHKPTRTISWTRAQDQPCRTIVIKYRTLCWVSGLIEHLGGP